MSDAIARGFDASLAGYLAGLAVGIVGGLVFLALLLLGAMEHQLYPHKVGTARHAAGPDRPSWATVAEANELIDLPPAPRRLDPLVIPAVYAGLAATSRFAQAVHSMAVRSARYRPNKEENGQ
jgi:hypothetical protein